MQEPAFWDTYVRKQSFGAVFYGIGQREDYMKRKNRKYIILSVVLLVMGTAIVLWIGYLRNNRIKQPKGAYMELDEARHLMIMLADKAGVDAAELFKIEDYRGEEEKGQPVCELSYGLYQQYIDRLASANMIDTETADTYQTKFDNKYKVEHLFLEDDFLNVCVELSELLCPEDAFKECSITALAGGNQVIRPEDESALLQDEILSMEEKIYKLSLTKEEEKTNIVSGYFQTINCIADQDEVFYVKGMTGADVTLKRCFIADNGEVLKGCFGAYCLAIPNGTDYNRIEDITDLIVKDGILSQVVVYGNKVHGKILSLGENYVELSMADGTEKKYEFSDPVKVYRLFGESKTEADETNSVLKALGYSLADLKVGYDFTDFVLDDKDKVVAALATRESAMEYIRVLIKNNDFAGIYHEKITLQCDTSAMLKSGNSIKEVEAGEMIEIAPDCALFESDRIFVEPAALTARTSVTSLKRSQGTPAYRGTLEIRRTEEGLICINELVLEEYLYSVVPSEMPSSYPAEALKAQAVSARTYAYQHMIKSSLMQYGAHVDDSTSYQVYNNILEAQSAIQAVRDTKGEIAMIGNDVAGTYFYSTSCGFGTDISVWHSDSKENTEHLHAKEIAKEQTISPQDMMDEETFRAYITRKNDQDFESEEGWYRWSYVTELDMERLENNLKNRYEVYPNQILTKKEDGNFASEPLGELGEIKDIVVGKRLLGGIIDELDFIGTKSTVRVVSERNVRFVLANQSDHVTRQSGDESGVGTMIPSAFAVINANKDEEGIVTGYEVIGGGYGHGIGMSQNGAKDMAMSGYSYEEILQFFYEGIKLVKCENRSEGREKG